MTQMTASEIKRELSMQARNVLALMGSHQIGAVVPPSCGAVDIELFEMGVIGGKGGLTIKGSVVAAKLQREWEDVNL